MTLSKLHDIHEFGVAEAKAGDIRVDRLEERLKPKIPFPHKHNFFHFLCLKKASGWHEIDFQRFAARAKQIFFVKPGEVHAWNFGAGTRGFVVEFSRESLQGKPDLLVRLDALPASFVFDAGAKFMELCELMLGETEAKGADRGPCLENLLCAFLLKLFRIGAFEKTAGPKAKGAIMDFLALVEEQFRREHAPEYYATRLGMSPKALTMRCRRSLAKPAGAVLRERLLLEAKRMLSYTESPIAEIGFELGFEDPNYFARFFRAQSGMAPGHFRKLARRTLG